MGRMAVRIGNRSFAPRPSNASLVIRISGSAGIFLTVEHLRFGLRLFWLLASPTIGDGFVILGIGSDERLFGLFMFVTVAVTRALPCRIHERQLDHSCLAVPRDVIVTD